MAKRQNHITSLRLPVELHQAIQRNAEVMDRSISSVYRMAIKQFVYVDGGRNG